MTHPGSGYETVVSALNSLPCVEMHHRSVPYRHPDDVFNLFALPHKQNNVLSIWGDVLLHNHLFSCDILYESCFFIFWSTKFDAQHPDWSAYTDAKNYHQYRLAGLKESYNRAKNATWNSLDFSFLES